MAFVRIQDPSGDWGNDGSAEYRNPSKCRKTASLLEKEEFAE